jgi:alcohol dehydrogenase (cytochrome c)
MSSTPRNCWQCCCRFWRTCRHITGSSLRLLSSLFILGTVVQAQVTYQDILNADKTPEQWVTYNGNYQAHRYSRLSEITSDNVSSMRLKWIFQRGFKHKFETSPLVVGNIIYLTVPPNEVYALDANSGAQLWHYERDLPPKVVACCGKVNRGLAIHGDRLFMGTLDAHLISLDRKTGRVLWESKLFDYKKGYGVTLAPLVVKDKVMVGTTGGEYGVRGFIDAYNVEDGRREWRFHTVPGPGEFGHDTWEGDSWKTGGSSVWVTPSFDPELNLTYWGIGNPSPDFNGDFREGDNLFSDSVVALDPDTGKRRWHFQFTPHDVHDWDAAQIMVLIDREFEGRKRKLLVTANRNGFYYVLDRETGEFLMARSYVKQTWAEKIDENGRPVRVPGKFPTEEGIVVAPSVAGGTNWMSPTYSPRTGLFYVTAREGSSMYQKDLVEYSPGASFWGGHFENQSQDPNNWWGAVRALDPLTGEKVWENRFFQPSWAGLLSTNGGLLFVGSREGHFKALDDETGKELWRLNLGGQVRANPISFEVNGSQRVAIAAGSGLFVFGLQD